MTLHHSGLSIKVYKRGLGFNLNPGHTMNQTVKLIMRSKEGDWNPEDRTIEGVRRPVQAWLRSSHPAGRV